MHLSISRRIIRDTAACRSRAAWYQVSLQNATKRHCAYNLFFSLVLKWFRESRSVALHVSFQARQTACMSFMKPESTNFCWRRRWKEGNVKKKKKKKEDAVCDVYWLSPWNDATYRLRECFPALHHPILLHKILRPQHPSERRQHASKILNK